MDRIERALEKALRSMKIISFLKYGDAEIMANLSDGKAYDSMKRKMERLGFRTLPYETAANGNLKLLICLSDGPTREALFNYVKQNFRGLGEKVY